MLIGKALDYFRIVMTLLDKSFAGLLHCKVLYICYKTVCNIAVYFERIIVDGDFNVRNTEI